MGVDVYLMIDMSQENQEFLDHAKRMNNPGIAEMIEFELSGNEWVMQFSTLYMKWLCWIITASDGDPGRIGFVEPTPNTRFKSLIPHGHPWSKEGDGPGDQSFTLSIAECMELKDDIDWFIREKMPNINNCEYLKSKTISFQGALQTAITRQKKMIIG